MSGGERNDGVTTRRRFLRTAGVGGAVAGAAWVAPELTSVRAVASASPVPPFLVSPPTAASVGGPATCSNDSVTVSVPAGLQPGDQLLAFSVSQANSTVSNGAFTSVGTEIEDSGLGLDTVRTTVFLREVDGTEPASYTFNRSSPGFLCLPRTLGVVLFGYRNSSGIDDLEPLVSPAAATSPQTFPSLVTSGPDRMVLRIAGATFRTLGDSSWGTISVGTQLINTGGGRSIVASELLQPAAGATGTATVPQSPAWYGVTWTIAMAPL